MKVNTSKARVLVVDEEPSVCEFLVKRLSGFACQSCSSGEEALELLQREAFDVIIAVWRMPGISGLALLEEARKKYPRLTLLMVTDRG